MLLNDFNKHKIEVDNNIENKNCFICKNNICNLKMGCRYFIFFECEKKCIIVNLLLNDFNKHKIDVDNNIENKYVI